MFILEGHLWKQNNRYVFKESVTDESLAQDQKELTDIMSRVQPRQVNEIPSQVGFCIDGGFIPGTDYPFESVSLGVNRT
jgi:hypothetical protein